MSGTVTPSASVLKSLPTLSVVRQAYWPRNAHTESTPSARTPADQYSVRGTRRTVARTKTKRSVSTRT